MRYHDFNLEIAQSSLSPNSTRQTLREREKIRGDEKERERKKEERKRGGKIEQEQDCGDARTFHRVHTGVRAQEGI